jgi:hypothetical protein
LDIGTKENPQKVTVDLTTSFDGLAIPSPAVSPNRTSYVPEKSATHQEVQAESEENQIEIDENKFSYKFVKNFVSMSGSIGKPFNSSMQFYYLDKQKETAGYELYHGGGYLGFTPSSWSDEMGIFNMFKHMPQNGETSLDLYSV